MNRLKKYLGIDEAERRLKEAKEEQARREKEQANQQIFRERIKQAVERLGL